MKNFRILFLLLCISLSAQQPTAPHEFPRIRSSLAVPVRIPLAEVAKTVNASVGTLIYQDDSYSDNNDDQFKVKVWKANPIRIAGGKNQNVIIEVPLKIWAEKGIGTLGVYTYQNTTFETVMYFSTSVLFNTNWKVTTVTQPIGFKWVTKPVLDYGKVKIPITPLIEASLKKQQADFCKTIDQQMSSKLDFQPYAVTAWNAFAQPFSISDEYKTWLKISPVRVNLAPVTFYADAIDVNLRIDTFSETFTGIQPSASPLVTAVPPFQNVTEQPKRFLLQTTANIPYSEARSIAEKTFLNREFDFREGQSRVKVTGINVYGEDGRVIIEAKTEGSVNGISYISGVPVYNADKRKIVLSGTKFRLKTKNILQKTAALLFQRKIVKMIEEEYGIPTQEMEDSARKSVEETFNTQFNKNVKMTGKVYLLQPSAVIVGASGLTAVIDTQASLSVLLAGF